MKLLLAPDLHCFPGNYGRVGPDGVHSRLAEWRRCAQALVRVACDREVDCAVFPGDFFLNARPAPAQVLEVIKLFHDLGAAGIPVVGCPGNHDLVPGQAGPCDLVAAAGDRIWSINTPDVFTLELSDEVRLDMGDEVRLQIAVLPAVKPSTLLAEACDPVEATQLVSQRLIEVARGLRLRCAEGVPRVLIGHWTVGGARVSSGQVLYGATEPTLLLAELVDQGWDAVLLGHIHKPQVLNERPFVGYAGSLLRNDFGEEGEGRGCWVIDLDEGTHEWVDLPAREFSTVHLNATDHDILDRIVCRPEEVALNVRDSITRVTYRATEEEANGLDHGAIIRALEAAGAHHVAGVFPEIIRADRARAAGLTESVKPLEALTHWLATRAGISPDVGAKALIEIQHLLEEVA